MKLPSGLAFAIILVPSVHILGQTTFPTDRYFPLSESKLETLTLNGQVVNNQLPASHLRLGEVYTGQNNTWEIRFSNNTGKSVTVTDAKACCGCVLEYQKGLEILPFATSTFKIRLLKKSSPVRFGNTIHLILDDSVDWPINIEAIYKSPFRIAPSRKELTEDLTAPFSVVVEVDEAAGYDGKFSMRPLMGFLRIISSEFNDKEGTLGVTLTASPQIYKSNGIKVETIEFMDADGSPLSVSIPFAVKLPDRILHKPSLLTLQQKSDSQALWGSGILTGSPELLRTVDPQGTLSILCSDGDGVITVGNYEVKASKSVMLVLEYQIPQGIENLKACEGGFKGILRDQKGKLISSVEAVQFSRIER